MASRPLLLGSAALFLSLALTPGALAATFDVQVVDSNYNPRLVIAQPGDTVRWTWANTNVQHSVTLPGSFDSGLHAGSFVFTHTFPEEGVFPYICLQHPHIMQGLVVVKA